MAPCARCFRRRFRPTNALAPFCRAFPSRSLKGPRPATHLVDRTVLLRAFAVLGPVEAVASRLAFTAVLLGSGWHPGSVPNAQILTVASGPSRRVARLGEAAVTRPSERQLASARDLLGE
jgi:hypothetical protein